MTYLEKLKLLDEMCYEELNEAIHFFLDVNCEAPMVILFWTGDYRKRKRWTCDVYMELAIDKVLEGFKNSKEHSKDVLELPDLGETL